MKKYFATINNAIGNQEKITAAKEKYRAYTSFPMMTSFNKTVSLIEKKQKGN